MPVSDRWASWRGRSVPRLRRWTRAGPRSWPEVPASDRRASAAHALPARALAASRGLRAGSRRRRAPRWVPAHRAPGPRKAAAEHREAPTATHSAAAPTASWAAWCPAGRPPLPAGLGRAAGAEPAAAGRAAAGPPVLRRAGRVAGGPGVLPAGRVARGLGLLPAGCAAAGRTGQPRAGCAVGGSAARWAGPAAGLHRAGPGAGGRAVRRSSAVPGSAAGCPRPDSRGRGPGVGPQGTPVA